MAGPASKVKGEEAGVADIVPKPATKEEQRAAMVSAVTDRLMEKYCGPNSGLAKLESTYQDKILEAGNDKKAVKAAQDEFFEELKNNYPFALLKKIDLGQKTLQAKMDAEDYTILDRKQLRAQIEKVVGTAIEDVNSTAKKVVTAQRQKEDGLSDSVNVQPLLVGFNEAGAIGFNNDLVRELSTELSPFLSKVGVEFVMHFPEEGGLGEGEPEMSILLRPTGKLAKLDLPSLKDIPKRA